MKKFEIFQTFSILMARIVGFAMCADGMVRFTSIFSVQVFNIWQGNSTNSIIVTHKSILKFILLNLQYS